MQSNILLTGGSGLLGTELQKYLLCYAPSHEEFNILHPKPLKKQFDLIIHAAAYTDVAKAEKENMECLMVNVQGTLNLLRAYPDVPFVYISSEYANNPVNFYSSTKYIAEQIVEIESQGYDARPYLIIRTLFKPNPYPWEYAFKDQWTQGDYVDVIAPLIAKKIKKWDKVSSGLFYIGTGRKTMFDLAKKTRSDVKPNSIHDIKDVVIPGDYL